MSQNDLIDGNTHAQNFFTSNFGTMNLDPEKVTCKMAHS